MKAFSLMELECLRHGIIPRGVNTREMVPLAATLARTATAAELDDGHLLKLRTIHRRLTSQSENLLPVEANLRKALNHRAVLMQREIMRINTARKFGNLPTIDPSFLSWKTQEGYPAFSIYGLNHPECRITATNLFGSNYSVSSNPDLHRLMRDHYLDDMLKENLVQQCIQQGLNSITITSRYDGVMPEEVRDRIRNYAPLFRAINIVAEAPVWSVERVAQIVVGDPLVIGVTDLGTVCLIAKYDLTSTEQFAHDLCVESSQTALN